MFEKMNKYNKKLYRSTNRNLKYLIMSVLYLSASVTNFIAAYNSNSVLLYVASGCFLVSIIIFSSLFFFTGR